MRGRVEKDLTMRAGERNEESVHRSSLRRKHSNDEASWKCALKGIEDIHTPVCCGGEEAEGGAAEGLVRGTVENPGWS